METKGLFITVEGIDGAGKGTQVAFLEAYLREKGIRFLSLREPGGTRIGEQIREILLGKDNPEMVPETELLLFAAARAQLVREVIRPALAKGQWVLCDRFYDSTLAYQAGGRGLDREMVQQTIDLARGGLEPDLTIYLDLDPEEARGRRKHREEAAGGEADRIERENLEFSKRVRAAYLALAAEKQRIVTIDAGLEPEEIRDRIRRTLEPIVYTATGGM